MSRSAIVAIDVEATGQFVDRNWPIQFGIAVVILDEDDEEHQLGWGSYVRRPEGRVWEPRCVNEFWLKNPDVYAKALQAQDTAPTATEVAEQMMNWLDRTLFGVPSEKITVITDNRAYDVAWLAWLLNHINKSPQYLLGTYTDIIDTYSYFCGASTVLENSVYDNTREPGLRAIWKEQPQLTHTAVDDAMVVLRTYKAMLNHLCR